MMHEQISLNGVSVVGFGDEEAEKKQLATVLGVPAAGFVVGVVGGALLGHLIKEGAGTVIGTIVGGIGGTIGGIALTPTVLTLGGENQAPGNKPTSAPEIPAPTPPALPPTPKTCPSGTTEIGGMCLPSTTPAIPTPAPSPAASGWQPVRANSTVKVGQRIAVAVAGMNGVPLPPEFIAQGTRMFELAAATRPELNAIPYPPGSLLPPNWPEDDDLGPGAYRYMVDAPVTAPLTSVAEIPTAGIPEMGVLMTFKAWARDKT